MKTLRYILFALSLPLAVSVSAQELAGSQVRIDNKAVTLGSDTQLLVGMDVTVPADMKLTTNSMLTLTPILMEKDSTGANKTLPSIYVYGRTRQLVAERTGKIPADAFEVLRRDNGGDQVIHYTARVPYEKWMNGSDLKMLGTIHGCANCLKEENLVYVYPVLLKRYAPQPVLAFVKPAAEIKNRDEKGNAYLDFPVNQTVIYPDYRRNPYELAEINRTIQVVKDNPDTEITGIELHGYASPEGSYANNTRLAEGGEGLSEGQLQRLTVARAILTNRPILLLDEATSALDGETEQKLLENIRQLKNKTCLIVTHRPAALEIADRILLVENKTIHDVK
jgi:hypothetical protein